MKFLPESIKTFLLHRFLEVSGIGSVVLSLFILISIISYSSFDSNIYNISNYETVNLGGTLGANISEILLQLFGYSSFLICFILVSWSYKLFFTKSLNLFALNILLLPIAVFLLSLFFEFSKIPISNGFVADQFFIFFIDQEITLNDYVYYTIVIFLFSLFCIVLYFTAGLESGEWKKIFTSLKVLIINSYSFISKIVLNLTKNNNK